MMPIVVLALLTLQGSVPMTTIAHGASSQIMQPRQVVAASAEAWQALWKEHSAVPPPADAADFAREAVVGVFLGLRPTAGYEVEITRVMPRGDVTQVEYVERVPEPGAGRAQVLTSPFHVVRIPRPAGRVVFVERQP